MATRHFSRALQSATKPMSSILSHSYTTAAIPRSSLSRLRPVVAAATATYVRRLAPSVFTRAFATRQTSSSLSDPNPNWSNRPPKETILLDGCDFEHWLVVMEKPEDESLTRDDIIDSYIKTLAMVLGSEEEARMKIYSVSTRYYYAFGALVPEELSLKLKELPKVSWVLPDSYLDVRNKDYGGEPFINGQAVPYDAKYHEEWCRNNSRANDRNRRNDRPRNNDRSRNFERRNNNSGGGGGGNFGGGGGGNFGGGGGGGGNFNNGPPAGNRQQIDAKYQQNYPNQPPPQNAPNAGVMQPQNFANNNPGNYAPRGPPAPAANNNGPNYQYGASNGPAPFQSGPGANQAGYVPATGQGANQNNMNQAYVPPNAASGNHYQNQNRGYVADGQNQGGYSAPQNAGYGQPQNQNTYVQGQNGYAPQNGGQGQNQGGGYVNPNVAGRDPNY